MGTFSISYSVFYDQFEDKIWTSMGSEKMGMARYDLKGKKLYDLIYLGEL